ncbi:LMOD1 protein [Aphelenchoides avenae]|nr:LMOD1 protein [Aphelenchus avenae]
MDSRMSAVGSAFSYYSEETTIAAPTAKNPSGGAGAKLYGRDLREFDDKDIENLLAKLSTDELEDLNNDFDPDNSLLPPSQRCRDQTDKEPTGPYQREKLLKHLEESAKSEKDWDESVPYSPGFKRGKVFEPKDDDGELDLDTDDDDDIDRAIDSAPERDLVDLAGILGMHNVLNQPQYYNALKGRTQDDDTGTSFNGVIKAYMPRIVPDEPENQTDVEQCIKRLESDDGSLEEVNLNNMKRVSKERIRSVIQAAHNSKHIQKLCLSNTAIGDSEARPLVELLESSPSLKVLNIESNYVSPDLIAKLLRATLKHQILVEFHAENQRASVLGNPIEMDIMQTVEQNETLLRVGVSLQSMEARHRVSEALERNYERLRLKRLEAKKAGAK